MGTADKRAFIARDLSQIWSGYFFNRLVIYKSMMLALEDFLGCWEREIGYKM